MLASCSGSPCGFMRVEEFQLTTFRGNSYFRKYQRDTEIFYIGLKTELIITITNVCCLHLWVYVFISVFLYLFACEKQFEFQTFGERTVLQSELISNPSHFFTAEISNLFSECVLVVSIFIVEGA